MNPTPTEVPLKVWLMDEAARIGVTPTTVYRHWLYKRRYRDLKVRRVNPRVIYVTVDPQVG